MIESKLRRQLMRVTTSKLLTAALCALSLGAIAVNAAAPPKATGTINFRTYAGDQRAGVRDRTAIPDGSFYPKRAEGPYFGYPGPDVGDDDSAASDVRENYNMELIGYFYPPRTGKIQFALCTDDPGELWLGTNDDPATKVQIATEPTWNPRRAFGAETRRTRVNDGTLPADRLINQSKFIDVVAGRPYFIQSIGTEFGGGDNSSIAFRYDTDPEFADQDKPILGIYLAPFYSPTVATVLSQPRDAFVFAGAGVTFSVAVDVGPTGTVTSTKWQKNGVDIANSNVSSLAVTATAAEDGSKYKAIVTTSIGTVTSAEATLNVATLGTGFVPGVLKWEVWRDIGGNAVSGLTDDPRYPASPTETRLLGSADAPVNIYEAFGARISGFVVPATSGNYVFFMAADDNAELYLSTDENPANKKLIAKETAWSNTKQWVTSGGSSDLAEKRSDQSTSTEWPTGNTITLTAGRRYYMELLYKEGGGGDNGAVTMITAGSPDPADGSTTLTGSLIGANASPNKGDVAITKQPVFPAQLEEGRSYRFEVDGIVTPTGFNFPLNIQWQKNGTAIAGATGKSLVISSAKAADAGTYRAVLSTSSGRSTNTVEKTLAVVPDTFAPVATAGALLKAGKQEIGVAFDENVKPATASATANYTLSAGTIDSIRVINRPATGFAASIGVTEYASSAVIVASGLTAGQTYNLTIKNVEDVKGNKNAAGQVVSFKAEDKKTFTVVGRKEAGFANADDVVRVSDEGFDVLSSGVAFWSDYDEATFVNESITGNFDKIVQLEYQDPSSQWARTGLMAREALDENKARPDRGACGMALEAGVYCVPKTLLYSRLQTVHANPSQVWDLSVGANNSYENHWRAEDTYNRAFGDQMQSADGGFGPMLYPNVWMRMSRAGNVLTTYRSTDGKAWTPMTTRTFPNLASSLFVGPFLAPELGNNGAQAGLGHGVMAKFRNYRDFSTGGTGGGAIGVERLATGLKLTYTGTLQSADAVTGPWGDVAGAASPATINFAGTAKFFRLKP
jgi:hypothetical protein